MRKREAIINLFFVAFYVLTFMVCEIAIGFCKKYAQNNDFLTSDFILYALRVIEIQSAIFAILEVLGFLTDVPIKKLLKRKVLGSFEKKQVNKKPRGKNTEKNKAEEIEKKNWNS